MESPAARYETRRIGKAAGLAAAGSFDGPFGMITAMIMARASRAAEAKAVAELARSRKPDSGPIGIVSLTVRMRWASRQAKERFSRSLSGPYRASVFFELLSLDHLIAMTDLEVTGTDKALAALRRFGSRRRPGQCRRPATCSTPSATSASDCEPFGPGIRVDVGDGSGHCVGGRVPAMFPGRPGRGAVATAVFHFPRTAVVTCGSSVALRELAAGCGRYTW